MSQNFSDVNRLLISLRQAQTRVPKVPLFQPILLDKEALYRQAKDQYKVSWRDSGTVNSCFSELPILRPKLLNNWQASRIGLTERSFVNPKGFKGYHLSNSGNLFGTPDPALTSQKFREYINRQELSHEQFVLRPSKFGKLQCQKRLQQYKVKTSKKSWQLTSRRGESFGFGANSTRRSETMRNRR